MFTLAVDVCGTIPTQLTNVIGTIVNLIKIAVPVLLIIFGMLDLGKAVMAQKEDEIKRGQQMFIKRLIAAAIVFFVIVIVQFAIQLISSATGDSSDGNVWDCVGSIVGAK